ncbi:head GIN domain-containing protein [Mangrovibacterium lignilyticum]|uniref:head GIN domain-containing protein n=1 Tax=Mangrovibacterium lignilyticum TaxID=2668052 RepID=UPI0013D6C3CE|nr:head GIN domain-containing protein [Mangrovibacterium lignilyticum]
MKTKPDFLVVLLAALAITISTSCSTDEKIEGNHQLTTEDRATSDFNQVVMSGSFNVYIAPGNEHSVTVRAESNLIDYIETDLTGKTLHIKSSDNVSLQNNLPMEIHVSCPEVHSLELEGSGSIEAGHFENDLFYIDLIGSGIISSSVNADKLQIRLSGSCQIIIEGECNQSDMMIIGSGLISSFKLEQDTCLASIEGSGIMKVDVSDLLDVLIDGSGVVLYQNAPEIRSSINGSGSVTPAN